LSKIARWWRGRSPAFRIVVHLGVVLLIVSRLAPWWLHRGAVLRVLLVSATLMTTVELTLGQFPRTKAYARWTRFVHGMGAVWTAVILSVVYAVALGPVAVGMKVARQDPLDRRLAPEPSFWRGHQANPLGPEAAARHQF
jgi:C4-dicarboxylate transporter